jgi:hypothetical protein
MSLASMRDFFLALARIWRGNLWNRAGYLLIAGGVVSLTSITQYLILAIGQLFGLQILIPETPTWIALLLIASGISIFILSRVLPDQPMQSASSIPGVKATINRDCYLDGWRSVQLHIMPPPGQEQTYSKHGWRIDGAKLVSPSDAVLARAKDDDYASGEFYPEKPTRYLAGKPLGHVQPFALEFFIKFQGTTDKGRKATFQVTLNHAADPKLRRTIRTWTTVPNQ